MPAPTALPVWNSDASNRSTPSAGKQASGHVPNEIPSSSEENWWKNLVYQHVAFLLGEAGADKFGDASDPDINVSGTTTTLSRDAYVENCTIANGTLVTNGFRLFVNGTLTMDATSVIECDGEPGVVDSTTGGAGAPQGSLGGGGNGADSPILSNTNGTQATDLQTQSSNFALAGGGSGGAGGDDNQGNTGGAARAGGNLDTQFGGFRHFPACVALKVFSGSAIYRIGGGQGGSSGALDDAGGGARGGAGGGGGGVVCVVARRAVLAAGATIRANGGDGGPGAVSEAGGGGGGGGGIVVFICRELQDSGAIIEAAGGAGGAGNNGGDAGEDGEDGTVIMLTG